MLKAEKTKASIADKNLKTAESIRINREKAAAQLGIGITKHVQETAQSRREHEMAMRQAEEESRNGEE